MNLTDQQWTIIEPLFEEKRRPDGRGRPWRDARAVLNGVLWVLRTGAPWHDLPDRYPPYQTCHRRPFYEGPSDVHVVGRNASQTKPAKFVVFLVKDKGAPILVPAN